MIATGNRANLVQIRCEQCGQDFTAKPRTRFGPRRFCTNGCHQRWKANQEGGGLQKFTCQHCGQDFMGYYRRPGQPQKFCSKSCYDAAQTKRQTTERKCVGCGTGFIPPKANAGQKYCTADCRFRSKKDGTARICARCGKVFYKSQGNRKSDRRYKTDYCSRKCHLPSAIGKQHYTCKYCGKAFENYPAKDGRPRLFCSRVCKSPDPNIEFNCLCCGKKVVRQKRGTRIQRFCTMACCKKFSGETSIETALRLALGELGIPFIQEHPVGRLSLDFYLPLLRVDLEADGDYWHRGNAERDARRDAFLAKRHQIETVRLTETEIKNSPDLKELVRSRLGLKRR